MSPVGACASCAGTTPVAPRGAKVVHAGCPSHQRSTTRAAVGPKVPGSTKWKGQVAAPADTPRTELTAQLIEQFLDDRGDEPPLPHTANIGDRRAASTALALLLPPSAQLARREDRRCFARRGATRLGRGRSGGSSRAGESGALRQYAPSSGRRGAMHRSPLQPGVCWTRWRWRHEWRANGSGGDRRRDSRV
jgi:hypothetical protein